MEFGTSDQFKAVSGNRSGRNSFWLLATPSRRSCACTFHGCLRHGTTVPTIDQDTVAHRLRVPVQVHDANCVKRLSTAGTCAYRVCFDFTQLHQLCFCLCLSASGCTGSKKKSLKVSCEMHIVRASPAEARARVRMGAPAFQQALALSTADDIFGAPAHAHFPVHSISIPGMLPCPAP